MRSRARPSGTMISRAGSKGGRGSRSGPGGAPDASAGCRRGPRGTGRGRGWRGRAGRRARPGRTRPDRWPRLRCQRASPGAGCRASGAGQGTVALDQVDQDALVEIDQPGGVDRRMVPGGAQERGLIHPERLQVTDRLGSRPAGGRARRPRHDRPPAHASSSASSDTGRAFSPTWRHASIPARRVARRRETCSEVSVQVRAAHNASRQRQRRLRHTSRAGARSTPDPGLPRPSGPAPRPAPRSRTTHHRGRRLDLDHDLRGRLGHRQHPEPAESQQRLGQTCTVATSRGLDVFLRR